MKAQQRSGGGEDTKILKISTGASCQQAFLPLHPPPIFSPSRCCYKHDCCYEGLHSKQCHPYIDHYRYLIINDDVLCGENNSHCAVLACECDRRAALCFRKYAKTYNKKYHRYPYVLCKEITPKCRGSKKPK
uniref:Phospholipase A2 n=1 Tax=Podarcis muralis TaxID=64176 RepID=A0A670K456_PODMU